MTVETLSNLRNRTRRFIMTNFGRNVYRTALLALAALALGTFCYRFAVRMTLPVLQSNDGLTVTTCLPGPCVCPPPAAREVVAPALLDRAVETSDGEKRLTSLVQAPADLDDNAFIIPNVYHFIRFDQPHVTFVEMLAIKSVLRFNPQLVLIHCNNRPEGKFWDRVKDDRRLVLVHRDPPADIYGKTAGWVQHKSDLVRIQVLREFGGIYMDNDCIMLRSVDHLRKGHRCVVAKSSKEKCLGNMFVMAATGCRYLAMYEDQYRTDYRADLWYYNAGELPTTAILDKYPDIAHVVDEGIEMDMIQRLFAASEPVEAFSSTYDVLHVFYRLRNLAHDQTDYNTADYRKYNNSFANLARWLLDT